MMNNVKELLPVGSVILLRGGKKKLMVFGVKQRDVLTNTEYDYIGVIYPEGHVGKGGQFFFNQEDVDQVFFRGYEDEDRDAFIERLYQHYEKKRMADAVGAAVPAQEA